MQVSHVVFWVIEHGADINVPGPHTAHSAHTVSVVAVQLATAMRPSGHSVHSVQVRSVVAVEGMYSYSSESHRWTGEHVWSVMIVAGVLMYAPAPHGVTGVHSLLTSVENVLNTTQPTHTRSLVAVAFTVTPVPIMHVVATVQLVFVATENEPSGQFPHVRSDDAVGAIVCISPAKQLVKGVQAGSSPLENMLRAQGRQMVCAIAVPGCAMYSPGLQSAMGTQGPLCPASGCVCPSSHGAQGVEASPSRSVYPGSHSVPLQDVAPAATNCPAAQWLH